MTGIIEFSTDTLNIEVSGINDNIPVDLVEVISTGQDVYVNVETSQGVLAVNGRAGFVTLNKSDVGLSNVENISITGVSGYLQGQINTISGMVGATSGADGQEGLVPKPVAGDNRYFLRGDGIWSDPTISAIQYIENSNNITLDVANYSAFVVNLTESATFTYSGFENGKSINVYLVGNHAGHIAHIFPIGTVFAELGDDNTIYSFEGYATRILLQKAGNLIYNFSSVVKLPSGGGGGSGGSQGSPGIDGGGVGIGLDLIELFLNELL